MLYEDGLIYDDVGVSSNLTMEQSFEYAKYSGLLEEYRLSDLVETIEGFLRTLAVKVQVTKTNLLNYDQPLVLDLSLAQEVQLRATIEELNEIEDLERLKKYFLTLLLVSFRVTELLRKQLAS